MTEQDFLDRTRTLRALRSILGLLGWDQETVMPAGGASARADAFAGMALLLHRETTDPAYVAWLREAVARESDPLQLRRARLLLRDCERKLRIPAALDAELASTSSQAQHVWIAARQDGNTREYLPIFQRLVELKRAEAACLVPDDGDAYDALLDGYEPGVRGKDLEPVFAELRSGLRQLLDQVPRASAAMNWRVPESRQEAYCRSLLERMGFSFHNGRLDRSAHPFTEGISAADVRLTVRYREDSPFDSVTSALHEGGHGLYEQGVASHFGAGDPLAEAVSLGVHESQSRFWENCIGRSTAFWEGEREHVGSLLGLAASPETIAANLCVVEPGLIRVDADEVCYNLHIALRLELERALILGSLAPNDVEAAWNDGMERFLGVLPSNPSEGWLQDIHWAAGLFGYFPTYTLGNLYAAQLLAAMRATIGDLDDILRRGELGLVLQWLRNHVHVHGRSLDAAALMQKATGRSLSAQDFLEYLSGRYLR